MAELNYKRLTIILIASAIILRLALAFTYAVAGDACWHLSAARFIAEEGRLPLFDPIGRDEPFWAPPLFHFIAAFFYLLFGENGLKLVSPLFGSGTLIVGFLLLRKFLSERGTFFGMLFFSFIPIMIDYSVLGYGEAGLTFFVVLALYLAFEERFFLSAIAAGLAILSKYNGVFVIPALLWIAYSKGGEKKWRSCLILCIVPLLIASAWFIRNFLELGNPIWPFLNFLFPLSFQNAYSALHLSNLLSLEMPLSLYLGFFGIPDGNYRALLYFDISHLWVFFSLFLLATIVFIFPLFFGFGKKKEDVPFYLLLLGFGLLFLIYVVNVSPQVSRMVMPALISLALFYGRGSDRVLLFLESHKRGEAIAKCFALAMVLVGVGFGLAIIGKFYLAEKEWSFYSDDFRWVLENTPKDSTFMVGGQCIQYHINRAPLYPSKISSQEYDYVWMNQNFWLDMRSVLDPNQLSEIGKVPLREIYSNPRTGTKVYRVEKGSGQ